MSGNPINLKSGVVLASLLVLLPLLSAQEKEPLVDRSKFEAATGRAINWLKTQSWTYDRSEIKEEKWQYDIGATALIGYVLLNNRVDEGDATIQAAAAKVREAAPNLTKTWAISWSIIFLDQCRHRENVDAISRLTRRLVRCQDPDCWGWGEDCPPDRPSPSGGYLGWLLGTNPSLTNLGRFKPEGTADGWHTQHAVSALWAGHGYGVDCHVSLARAETRFRKTQKADGGWGPHHDSKESTPEATCAGLITLAVSYGSRHGPVARIGANLPPPQPYWDTLDLGQDDQLIKAFAYLDRQLAMKPEEKEDRTHLFWSRSMLGIFERPPAKCKWYLRQVAATLQTQSKEGGWPAQAPSVIRTAETLLLLKRTYLFWDLRTRADLRTDKHDVKEGAIRAMAYLRSHPLRPVEEDNRATWQQYIGDMAMVGLALRECGVPVNDPDVQKALTIVREAAPRLTRTGSLSFSLLFFDGCGDPKDQEVIAALAMRLAAGQDAGSWGWSEECPLVQDQDRLRRLLLENRQKTDLGPFQPGGNADTRNTQLALVALWNARQFHEFPADLPLLRAAERFRQTQHADGGWGMSLDDPKSPPSATCTGLMSLMQGFIVRQDQVRLAGGKPAPAGELDADPRYEVGITLLIKQMQPKPKAHDNWPWFLWSMERFAAVAKLRRLNEVEPYAWCSGWLNYYQNKDGSWTGSTSAPVTTALALVTLRPANLLGQMPRPLTPADFGFKEVSKSEAPRRAAQLREELLKADPQRQQAILEELCETLDPTGHYTQALADVIAMTRDKLQASARSALANRLARQKLDSLRKKLGDNEEDMEIRIAAARAMGMKTLNEKPDTRALPDLIKLLDDKNELLAAAAEESLRALTQKDFGRDKERWTSFYQALPKSRQ